MISNSVCRRKKPLKETQRRNNETLVEAGEEWGESEVNRISNRVVG